MLALIKTAFNPNPTVEWSIWPVFALILNYLIMWQYDLLLRVSYITANLHCKSRNLSNTDIRNYSIDFAVISEAPSKYTSVNLNFSLYLCNQSKYYMSNNLVFKKGDSNFLINLVLLYLLLYFLLFYIYIWEYPTSSRWRIRRNSRAGRWICGRACSHVWTHPPSRSRPELRTYLD